MVLNKGCLRFSEPQRNLKILRRIGIALRLYIIMSLIHLLCGIKNSTEIFPFNLLMGEGNVFQITYRLSSHFP